MGERIWRVDYQGRTIEVFNRFSWLPPRTSEGLKIDGAVVCEGPGSLFRPYATIREAVTFEGREKVVEARIAQKTGSLRMGCHIFVGGELIGGDRDSKIQHPDPEEAKRLVKLGLPRFLVRVGILRFGLPFGLAMSFVGERHTVRQSVLQFGLNVVFLGGLMGAFQWRAARKLVTKEDRADLGW